MINPAREYLLKEKAKYSRPPCTNQFRSVTFNIENIFLPFNKTSHIDEEVNCTENWRQRQRRHKDRQDIEMIGTGTERDIDTERWKQALRHKTEMKTIEMEGIETGSQRNKETEKQADKNTDRQDRQMYCLADRQTDRKTDIWMSRHINRHMNGWADKHKQNRQRGWIIQKQNAMFHTVHA